jgi:hypothetical protein
MANGLKITFFREGVPEDVHIAADGAAALMSAVRIITGQDELRAGDKLTVERDERPNIVERGLA